MMVKCKKWLLRKSGQAVSEYTLIIAVVVIASVSILYIFRDAINFSMSTVRSKFQQETAASVGGVRAEKAQIEP